MKKLIIFFFGLLFLFSCSNDSPTTQVVKLLTVPDKYPLLGSSYDAGNRLLVFEIKEDKNSDSLVEYCKSYKDFLQSSTVNSDRITHLVFFDDKKYYKMTKFPPTSAYSPIDGEEKLAKHIKATYDFNRINGYSMLTFYDKNSYESIGKEIKI